MTFGQRIRVLRKERDLTQAEVGKVIGVSERTVGYYETDERFPPEDVLSNIANFFQVSVDYLMGRTENVEKSQIDELEELKRQLISGELSTTATGIPLTKEEITELIAFANAQLRILKKIE